MFQTCDAVHQGLCSPAFSVITFGLCSVHITYYSLVDHPFSLTLCVWGHYMYECVCTSVWICRAHKLASGVCFIFTYVFKSGSLTDWWGWLATSSRTPPFLSPSTEWQTQITTLGFSQASGLLNSGPLACAMSTWPSLQPLQLPFINV